MRNIKMIENDIKELLKERKELFEKCKDHTIGAVQTQLYIRRMERINKEVERLDIKVKPSWK